MRLEPGQYIYDPQKDNWSPRIGLAYKATSEYSSSRGERHLLCCERYFERRAHPIGATANTF